MEQIQETLAGLKGKVNTQGVALKDLEVDVSPFVRKSSG